MKLKLWAFTMAVSISLFSIVVRAADEDGAPEQGQAEFSDLDETSIPTLIIEGSGKTASFTIDPKNLRANLPISITASAGFSVSPSSIADNVGATKVTVTFNTWAKEASGRVVIRNGDTRSYVKVVGRGTALPQKDLSQSPLHTGEMREAVTCDQSAGFAPSSSGYTIECKVNSDGGEIQPFFVTDEGVGIRAYINDEGMGILNGTTKRAMANPATSVKGGLGKLYNDDGRSHTYRFAVTPDHRVFSYRDGILIDVVRAIDYGLPEDFATGNGEKKKNLLLNSAFEGEFELATAEQIARTIEGWDVGSFDIWNSRQFIVRQEINDQQDLSNHVLRMQRYKWAAGWGAGEVSQIVNVAPNETYTFTCLARGGIRSQTSKELAAALGKMKIAEVQDKNLGSAVDISTDEWDKYALEHTTSGDCKQLRVSFVLAKDKRGATISPLDIDNVQLSGMSRTFSAKTGYSNRNCKVDYFTYDLSGAFAPPQPALNINISK